MAESDKLNYFRPTRTSKIHLTNLSGKTKGQHVSNGMQSGMKLITRRNVQKGDFLHVMLMYDFPANWELMPYLVRSQTLLISDFVGETVDKEHVTCMASLSDLVDFRFRLFLTALQLYMENIYSGGINSNYCPTTARETITVVLQLLHLFRVSHLTTLKRTKSFPGFVNDSGTKTVVSMSDHLSFRHPTFSHSTPHPI